MAARLERLISIETKNILFARHYEEVYLERALGDWHKLFSLSIYPWKYKFHGYISFKGYNFNIKL